MVFNLIHDEWIPVKRADGARQIIAPWQLTAYIELNPIVSLDASRPDFNGSMIQFLIGLVQTTMAPVNDREWKNTLKKPPKPRNLRDVFEKVSNAFNLDDDGPRFMQDFNLDDGTENEIDVLLVEMPGEKTIEENKDHFLKRGSVKKICLKCCAIALFSLQTNAPSGGQGNRTSLRGGGPLTTIVLGTNLWETVWMNTLNEDFFSRLGDMSKSNGANIFPWLGPTHTSEKGQKTTPQDVNPKQMFWGMPRRIRVDFSKNVAGICDICGCKSEGLVTNYIAKNYGINYEGGWRHVLTPHRQNKTEFFPIHGNPGGISYRHWLGVIQNDEERGLHPAAVVNEFKKRQSMLVEIDAAYRHSVRIWALGYDFDNMKARGWNESQMPFIHIDEQYREIYERTTFSMIKISEIIVFNLRGSIKQALFENSKSPDLSIIDNRFWHESEDDFYRVLDNVRETVSRGGSPIEIKREWVKSLSKKVEKIFDNYSQSAQLDVADPKKIALSRRDLKIRSSEKGNKKLKDLIDI